MIEVQVDDLVTELAQFLSFRALECGEFWRTELFWDDVFCRLPDNSATEGFRPRQCMGEKGFFDQEKLQSLVRKAFWQGDAAAEAVVLEIAAQHIEQYWPLPLFLRDFVSWRLREIKDLAVKRSRRASRNFLRDFIIVNRITKVVSLGFHATRNEASEREFACAIVARAIREAGLDLSEAAVVKIWSRRRDFQFARPELLCGAFGL